MTGNTKAGNKQKKKKKKSFAQKVPGSKVKLELKVRQSANYLVL